VEHRTAGLPPRVSVVLPSYNHEPFLARALDSVLAQTYQDFEIVITDDASTDGSVDVLRTYAKQDSRIRLFVNRFNYETHSVNNGIRHACGEYVALLHSDDEFWPTKLEKQVRYLDDHPEVAAVFTRARIVNQQGQDFPDPNHCNFTIFNQPNRSRHEWLNYFFVNGNCLCHPSLLIRRSVYDTLGLYNPLMSALDDFDMWVRVCLHHEIHVLQQTLVNFRLLEGEGNASGDRPENFRRGQFEWLKILDHFQSDEALEQLHEIFPEMGDQMRGASDAVKRHALARMAVKHENAAHRLWGINLLYELQSNPEIRRELAHEIGFAPDGDFVKLNGSLNPFASEYRPTAQVYWPVAGAYSELNSRSAYFARSQWSEVRFPLPAWDTATPVRFDPCTFPCVINIAEVRIRSRSDGACLWKCGIQDLREATTLAGTALWLADQGAGTILSTGTDAQIYLTGVPQLPNLPLELQVWLKVETDLSAVEAEIRAARSLAAEQKSTLATLEAQVEALNVAAREREDHSTILAATVETLTTSAADREGVSRALEARLWTLEACIAGRDAELHRLRNETEMLKAAAAGQALELQTVLNSRSWHYTRPLRGLRRILGRGR
jgi:Glycosyl transferase family 2